MFALLPQRSGDIMPGVTQAILTLSRLMGDAFSVVTRASSILRRDGAPAGEVGAVRRELQRKRTDYPHDPTSADFRRCLTNLKRQFTALHQKLNIGLRYGLSGDLVQLKAYPENYKACIGRAASVRQKDAPGGDLAMRR
jgi:hypothetical protein